MPGILSNVISRVRDTEVARAYRRLPVVQRNINTIQASKPVQKAAQFRPETVQEYTRASYIGGQTVGTNGVLDCTKSPPMLNGHVLTPREAVAFCGHM